MAPLTPTAVQDIFSAFSSDSADTRASFFNHVLDDVNWTVMGHCPLSGIYNSKQDFIKATVNLLGTHVLTEPLRMAVHNVIVGEVAADGSQTAVVEMKAIDAKCNNGLVFDNVYCWVCKFVQESDASGNWKIGKVRAYVDTDLVKRAVEENKKT